MSDLVNRKWVVASRPEVEVEQSNFELKEEPIPPLEPGHAFIPTEGAFRRHSLQAHRDVPRDLERAERI